MQELAWQALGLTQDPFPTDGPDDLFLQTPSLGQRFSLFLQLAQASDLTLLLIGERGVGKTTFLNQLGERLDEGWLVVIWQATRDSDYGDLLACLRDELMIEPHEDAIAALEQHLQDLHAHGQHVLLAIDDAHELSDVVLAEVLNLGPRLRLALAGQMDLANRVAAFGSEESLSDAGLAHRIVLGELNLPQTTDYLRARLNRCGFSGTSPFSSDVCAQIFKQTRGVPQFVNEQASEFLETGLHGDDEAGIELDPPPRPDTSAVKARLTTHAPIQPRISLHTDRMRRVSPGLLTIAAIAAIAVLMVALGISAYEWLMTPAEPQTAVEAETATNDAQTDERYPELPQAPPPPPPSVLADQGTPLVSELPGAAAADNNRDDAPLPASTNDIQAERDAAASLSLAPLPALPPTAETEPAPAPLAPDSAPVLPVETSPAVLPRPRAAPRARRGDSAANGAEAPARPAVAADPAPAPARTERPAASAGAAAGNTWLQSGDRNRYTIQLIALGSASATRQFISANQLEQALIVSLKTPDDKPLFAVVQGVYDRRESASNAIRKLPLRLRQESPWPRHIGTLLDSALEVRQTSR